MSKVKITGNASGTGTLTISAPNTNTDRTLTLPDGAGEILLSDGDGSNLTGISTGKVLQVVSTYKTDTFTTTSASWTDLTGMSVSITPSSTSSKILVSVVLHVGHSGGTYYIRLHRNGSTIGEPDGASTRPTASIGGEAVGQYNIRTHATQYLDSPNSTSALTYKLVGATNANTLCINRSSADRDGGTYDVRVASTITVMEIGA